MTDIWVALGGWSWVAFAVGFVCGVVFLALVQLQAAAETRR